MTCAAIKGGGTGIGRPSGTAMSWITSLRWLASTSAAMVDLVSLRTKGGRRSRDERSKSEGAVGSVSDLSSWDSAECVDSCGRDTSVYIENDDQWRGAFEQSETRIHTGRMATHKYRKIRGTYIADWEGPTCNVCAAAVAAAASSALGDDICGLTSSTGAGDVEVGRGVVSKTGNRVPDSHEIPYRCSQSIFHPRDAAAAADSTDFCMNPEGQ